MPIELVDKNKLIPDTVIPSTMINFGKKEDLHRIFLVHSTDFTGYIKPTTVKEYKDLLNYFNKLYRKNNKKIIEKQKEELFKQDVIKQYEQLLEHDETDKERVYQVMDSEDIIREYKLNINDACKFNEEQMVTNEDAGIIAFTDHEIFHFAVKAVKDFEKQKQNGHYVLRIGVCNRQFVTDITVADTATPEYQILHRTKTIHGVFLSEPTIHSIETKMRDIIDKRLKHVLDYNNDYDDLYKPDTMFYIMVQTGEFGARILKELNENHDKFMIINPDVYGFCVIHAIYLSYLFYNDYPNLFEYFDDVQKHVDEIDHVQSCYYIGGIIDLADKLDINIIIYRGTIQNYYATHNNFSSKRNTNKIVRVLLLTNEKHAAAIVPIDKYLQLISDTNKMTKDQRYYNLVKYSAYISSLPINDLNTCLLNPINPNKTYYNLKNSAMKPMNLIKNKKEIGCFDIETYNDQNGTLIPYLLVFAHLDKSEMTVFRGRKCIEEFVKFISKKDMILYAHNGSKFDFILLLTEIEKYFYKYDVWRKTSDGYPRFIFKNTRIIRFNFYNVDFKDSYMLLCNSLNKLSNGGKLEFDHTKVNEETVDDIMEEAVKYCVKDVECLCDVISKYSKLIPKELLKKGYTSEDYFFSALTITQLSKIIFYNLPNKGKIYNLNTIMDRKLRPTYFGGKNFANYRGVLNCDKESVYNSYGEFVGDGKIYYVDVNSLYPYIAMKQLFSHGNYIIMNIDNESLKNKSKFMTSFICCSVIGTKEMLEPNIPPFLVYRDDNKQSNCYINEEKEMILFYPEYCEALKCGYQIKAHQVIKFSRSVNLFYEFFNTLYELRKSAENDKAFKLFLKLIMNSFTGSLGQKYENVQSYQFTSDIYSELTNFLMEETVTINDEIMSKQHTYVNGERTNVALISEITSYSRILMHQMFRKIVQSGGILLYSDTDSVIYIGKHPSDIDIPYGNDIGQLKIEAIIKSIAIANLKCYAYQTIDGYETVVHKGFQKEMGYDTFSHKLLNGEILEEHIHSRLHTNIKRGIIEAKDVDKYYSLELTKGIGKLNSFVEFQTVHNSIEEEGE